MKRILINATQPEELRVAIVDGQKLHDLDIEVGSREQRKANIYKGRVTRVEPSLEAAFIDYGGNRHGFLPLKEVAKEYFDKNKSKNGDAGNGKDSIKYALSEGQEIIVQVEKEERGNKGAALTTFVSLAGRYLVLMPNNPRAGGVSRRIEGEERNELREALNQVEVPNGMGVIVRTAGVGRCAEELQWDLDYLAQVWKAINEAAEDRKAPFLVYQESNVIIRALRDYLRDDIGEVVIDQDEIYATGREFMQQVMPHALNKLKYYTDETPLFSRFQVESQIESAFEREVTLPSGGSIVIDHTEAMTSVDINSARATKGGGIEETAFNTNLEAAEEVARQLRIRDLGGLVVIDFIDMESSKNQREVENRLKQAAKVDRARVQIGRISRFGLLEMSRQRLKPSLSEYSSQACPRCLGRGSIRSVESLSLSILRLLEEEAMKPSTGRVIVQLPVAVASFLLNEKRDDISGVEKRSKTQVTLVPNGTLETPHYEIRRVRGDQLAEDENDATSYRIDTHVEIEKPVEPDHAGRATATREEPAVKRVSRPDAPVIDRTPAPQQAQAAEAAASATTAAAVATMTPWQQLLDALRRMFSGSSPAPKKPAKTDKPVETAAAQANRKKASKARADKQDSGTSSDDGAPRKSRPSRSRRGADDGGSSNNRSRRGGRNRRGGQKNDGAQGDGRKPERGNAGDNNDNARKKSDHDKSAADDKSSASADGSANGTAEKQKSRSATHNNRNDKAPEDNNRAADSAAQTDDAGTTQQATANPNASDRQNDDNNDSQNNGNGRRRRRRGGRGRRGGRNRNSSAASSEDNNASSTNENNSASADDAASADTSSEHNRNSEAADDRDTQSTAPRVDEQPSDDVDQTAQTPRQSDDSPLNADSGENSAEQPKQAQSKASAPAKIQAPDDEEPWSAIKASENARVASENQAAPPSEEAHSHASTQTDAPTETADAPVETAETSTDATASGASEKPAKAKAPRRPRKPRKKPESAPADEQASADDATTSAPAAEPQGAPAGSNDADEKVSPEPAVATQQVETEADAPRTQEEIEDVVIDTKAEDENAPQSSEAPKARPRARAKSVVEKSSTEDSSLQQVETRSADEDADEEEGTSATPNS
ncbi:Rne/Rng family ribonuclease [Salinisphaera aquimarina]|uniref:Ribonuclease E n=1 Tax=Salinisphaera aquimarina TaxID=2094031 RepID=A0ABV7ERA1_9GAMM